METTISGISAHHTIPENNAVKTKTFKTTGNAEEAYLLALQRLLNVNRWNVLVGKADGRYQLTNNRAIAKTGNAEEGDFVQIKYSTPASDGKAEEWLRVDRIITRLHIHDRSISMVLRPTQMAIAEDRVTYSFNHETTITITVQLNEAIVTTGAYVKSEEKGVQKDGKTTGIIDKIRHALQGVFSWSDERSKWHILTEGLLR